MKIKINREIEVPDRMTCSGSMKRLYSVTVHGNAHTWSCLVWMKPQHAAEWREDGVEVDEVIHIIPETIQRMGLTKPWCWLQKIGLIPLSGS